MGAATQDVFLRGGSPECRRLGRLGRCLEASTCVISIHIPMAKASHSGSQCGSLGYLVGKAMG